MQDFGLWSIVPPLVAILLAFLTREVIVSLFAGILAGGVIFVVGSGRPFVDVPTVILDTLGTHMAENIHMVIFLLFLGSLVAVIAAAGGAQAYGEWAYRRLGKRSSASLLTALLGMIIFIDDYFNCLTVGTVMRPITDKFRISREKLAYIIDASAAPVCIIAPISSWAAFVVSCIPEETTSHGMSLFLASIPWNFYAFGALVLMFLVCRFESLEFGPMRDAERVTRRGHDIGADRNAVGMAVVPSIGKGRVFDLVLPIVVLILFSVLAMLRSGGYFDGTSTFARAFANADSGPSLSLASLCAVLFSFLLFVPRKLIGLKDFSSVVVLGMKTMIPAVVMLCLAWTISGICDELLGTGRYLSSVIGACHFPMWCLPALFFVLSAALAFATGASWGALGILVPVAAKIGFTGDSTAAALLLGAVLAGAVQGDHCSPISDTTILSSTGAGCRHHNHVVTQMPYALAIGVLATIGYIVAGAIVM